MLTIWLNRMVKAKKEENTEAQILLAAKNVFRAKGFAGARMQEIADEAKINKAMLHYYFRSKELLFERIFIEAVQGFFGTVVMTLNDPSTDWKEKLRELADKYTDFLKANPDIPVFVVTEINRGEHTFFDRLPIGEMMQHSLFIKQILEAQKKKQIQPVAPIQIVMMMISGLVFPFMAKPVIRKIGSYSEKQFIGFLDERKTLVPEMVICYLEKTKRGKK